MAGGKRNVCRLLNNKNKNKVLDFERVRGFYFCKNRKESLLFMEKKRILHEGGMENASGLCRNW